MRYPCLLLLLSACTAPSPPPTPTGPAVVARGSTLIIDELGLPGLRDTRFELVDGKLQNVANAPQASAEVPSIYGDLITPGLVDAHAHLEGLGRQQAELNLVDLPTYDSVLDAISAHAKRAPPGTWVLGRGWDQNDWPDAPMGGWPTAKDLDAVSHGHPVALRRIDGHATWANHAALTASDIDVETQSPVGGQLHRTADGEILGVLVDNAADLLKVPEPTLEQRTAWVQRAQESMLEHGLVGIHDMGTHDDTLGVLRQMDKSGELRVRVWSYLSAGSEGAAHLLTTGPQHGRRLHVVGIKAYADGALGSRGALLGAPYTDKPDHHGLAVMPRAELQALAVSCLRARIQLAVHAIGDQAVHEVLNVFEEARSTVPEAAGVRLRVEHAQVVRPADQPRFKTLQAVASMQPTHATSDMGWAEERLGAERIAWSYAWRDLANAGAPVALGSDFPVESVDPLLGIWAATRRTSLNHEPSGGWRTDQALTLPEALDGFTRGAAWAAHAEDQHGVIANGRSADLVILRKHIRPPDWRVHSVYIDGQLEWSFEGNPAVRPTEVVDPSNGK